ncbi:SRPBCC family protein [Aquipseudomonas ullengensis]|uniref:SRPBCC family protein n=1 Tax=Aquipseudomonas ullengensis TaxID=2759166 RepID=A0A7W4LIA6_9GAMM|nr:SRPBCC family protein [Pseudomonas ullengensis]MBB2493582.1 SRPBCC family protein [Pseudomonas ullengensis]
MLGIILLVVLALVAGFAVLASRQPDEFRVERSTLIQAPVERVFAQVEDFHQWHQWSPWARRDPAMQVSYEGAAKGVGAVYRWSGNRQVGKGSCAISESRANEWVRMQLEFLEPFQASNVAEFHFQPEAGGTRVSWSMSGRNTFISKAMGLLFSMDKMVGGDFEQGLASLKARAEAAPAQG